jgi:uncharacterized membrane protein
MKDIAIVLDGAHWLQFVIYGVVFLLSTYLIYKQKIATQWIVIGTIALGLLVNFVS